MKLVDGWYITDDDTAINAHPVRRQMAKDIRVIEVALRHIVGRDCVIQAGARVGLWPKTLAQHFRTVITFEPETRNYECAVANLSDCSNVELHKAALGAEHGSSWISYSDEQSGSHWLQKYKPGNGESCEIRMIDSLGVSPDAIFLDIEGFEMFALEGARKTIEACKPVLVLEENSARERYGIQKGKLTKWLAPHGYRVVDRVGKDLLFVA